MTLPVSKERKITMSLLSRILALLLAGCVSLYASSEGNSWDKVRYNGGTLQTKVDPKDWSNHLAVTSDSILLKLKDGQQIEIPAKSVTALSYGQEAHRRVGTMIALGILVAPLALFGLMHKTRLHFIGIEYKTPDGKGAGLLLQGDKENYRAILTALEAATDAPLSVSEKDRDYVPGLRNVQTVKAGTKDEPSAQAKNVAANDTATVSIKSTPENADVSIDGNFMGNTPASLKMAAGKHTVKVSLSGYREWSREITVSAGSEINLSAALEKP
jgi:PEGA domain-containing protein